MKMYKKILDTRPSDSIPKKIMAKLANAIFLIIVFSIIIFLGWFLVQGLPLMYEYASIYISEARLGEILVEIAAVAGAFLLAYIVFA